MGPQWKNISLVALKPMLCNDTGIQAWSGGVEMPRYWKIAIGVSADVLPAFEDGLGPEESAVLSIADEIRKNDFGKLWLFKSQNWDMGNPVTKCIVKTLKSLGDGNYIYARRLSPSCSRIEVFGSFPALRYFRPPDNSIITGNIFEDINF